MRRPWKSLASASRAALALGSLALGACQTNDDPAEGGLIDGIANLSTGGYQKRLDERQSTLTEAEQRQATLRDEAAAADARRARAASELAAAETQLASLDGELRELSDELLKAETSGRLKKTEKERLEREVEDLKDRLALVSNNPGLDAAAKKAEAARLKEQLKRLEEDLATVLAD